MAIVYSACRAYEVLDIGGHLERIIPYTFSKMLFIIVQSTFLILLHRLVVLVEDRLFSFILLHLVTVNICMWVKSVIVEISDSMMLLQQNGNETILVKNSQAVEAAAYFLPGTAEYCAIAASIIYEMLQRVGQFKQIEADHEELRSGGSKQNIKANLWLICGSIFSMLIVVTILILVNIENLIDSARAALQLSETSLIHVACLIFAIYGILDVRNLKFTVSFAKNNLDEKLLLITFFLAFNYFVASAVICIDHLANATSSSANTGHVIAKLINLFLEIIQAVVQTYFIHDMFHRCCHRKEYGQSKPEQPFIIALSVLNFMLWMIYSFQVKKQDVLSEKSGNNFEGSNLQGLITLTRVLLPMTMLFRYHSSVCLAICSVRIYEDEITRYEYVLRWIKKDTTVFTQNHLCGPLNFCGLVDGVRQQTWHEFSQTQSHLKPVSTVCQLAVRRCRSAENIRGSFNVDYSQVVQDESRRDTTANLEMARIRVVATEEDNRLPGFKLIRSQLVEGPINESKSEISNQIFSK
ncbi:hypothetical protein P879_09705 [Paragonimus westermani]|uniref:Otopetrin n=1 Tax=Paragonimus westermani TaxID=34504 RepID=A0A8T0D840_9TREM|nr:hypothetical protein P879_09705 [Paragonimus westermani]